MKCEVNKEWKEGHFPVKFSIEQLKGFSGKNVLLERENTTGESNDWGKSYSRL